MSLYHLGIDVSKAKLDCALRFPSGKYRDKVVENTKRGFTVLTEWLSRQDASSPHVCMEATGVYWEAVAEHLAEAGMVVSVINPAQIKAFGGSRLVRTKTDKADARLIADFCHERQPLPWQAPSPSIQILRALVLRLEALQTMRTQENNRLEVSRDAVKTGIVEHLAWLDAQIKQLIKQINDHINGDPDLKAKRDLLDTIPGIGERTIASMLAFYDNLGRFGNAKQAAAYAGLDPRIFTSGTSVAQKPRLSKIGHAFLRKALCMPAIVTLFKTAWGKRFRDRLAAAGKPPKVIICAMMRKLIHVVFGVLKSGTTFNAALHGA